MEQIRVGGKDWTIIKFVSNLYLHCLNICHKWFIWSLMMEDICSTRQIVLKLSNKIDFRRGIFLGKRNSPVMIQTNDFHILLYNCGIGFKTLNNFPLPDHSYFITIDLLTIISYSYKTLLRLLILQKHLNLESFFLCCPDR